MGDVSPTVSSVGHVPSQVDRPSGATPVHSRVGYAVAAIISAGSISLIVLSALRIIPLAVLPADVAVLLLLPIGSSKLADRIKQARSPLARSERRNREWMRRAEDAGQSVIPEDQVSQFINPNVLLDVVFERGQELGSGGVGTVSLWTRKTDGLPFAIKEFTSEYQATNEFAIGLALDHESIVTVHNVVEKNEDGVSKFYLIMDLVEGSTFITLRRARLRDLDGEAVLLQLTGAFNHMRASGVRPGDLNKGNLMLRKDGCVVFVDFGGYAFAEVNEERMAELVTDQLDWMQRGPMRGAWALLKDRVEGSLESGLAC